MKAETIKNSCLRNRQYISSRWSVIIYEEHMATYLNYPDLFHNNEIHAT